MSLHSRFPERTPFSSLVVGPEKEDLTTTWVHAKGQEEEEGGEDEERAFDSRWHLSLIAVEWDSGADTIEYFLSRENTKMLVLFLCKYSCIWAMSRTGVYLQWPAGRE